VARPNVTPPNVTSSSSPWSNERFPSGSEKVLEERQLAYIVVARLTTYLKSRLYQLNEWQAIDVDPAQDDYVAMVWLPIPRSAAFSWIAAGGKALRSMATFSGRWPPIVLSIPSIYLLTFYPPLWKERNTRRAYARACWQFFDWCAAHGLELTSVRPFHCWLPGSRIFRVPNRPLSKSSLHCGCRSIFWPLANSSLPTRKAHLDI
jgi:hypothetical protein